jgi:hypothetical protein
MSLFSCNVPDLKATFKYGRTDCPTSPVTTAVLEFPSPTMARRTMFAYFAKYFNFTEKEVRSHWVFSWST